MPPLNKEALRQLSRGELGLAKFLTLGFLGKGRKRIGSAVYYTDFGNKHTRMLQETRRDSANGSLVAPEGAIETIVADAGIIDEKNGIVIFSGHSTTLEKGNDPVEREITGKFAQDEIADQDTKVLWESAATKP